VVGRHAAGHRAGRSRDRGPRGDLAVHRPAIERDLERLATKQQELGRSQEALAKKMNAAAERYESELRRIREEAMTNGKAEPVQ
jgi:hypothetical protein